MNVEEAILAAAGAVFLVTILAKRASRFWLTEPFMAVLIGIIVGSLIASPVDLQAPIFLTFLELTLALVLFSDASRISLRSLRGEYSWPLRMLAIGLPLAIILGTLAVGLLLGLPWGFALLVGVVLAPTDAALAAPVLENHSIPARIRQSLNVESGLNDGLAVPALLIAVGLLEAEEGVASAAQSALIVIQQLGIGIVGGVALGALGAWVIGRGAEKGWMNLLHQKIAALSLALAGFALIQLLGGSGFVAVFIAGLVMSHRLQAADEHLYDFAEAEGHILVTIAFLIVGAGPVTEFLSGDVSWQAIGMALLSLIVIRPLAIAVSLIGEKLQGATVAFLGWFGPRGLATIVFYLIAIEEIPDVPPLVSQTVFATLVLSIALHGLTAVPGAKWLSNRLDSMEDEDMPEMMDDMEDMPTRGERMDDM